MTNASQLERVRYWQGQLLSSSDLQTQMSTVAELRRLHNRAVHSAYGVAIGLFTGDIADGAIPVTCGLAYDCSGRELMVPVSTTVPLPTPAITAPTLLVIAYDSTAGFATLTWRPQGQPGSTDGVAIARIVPGTPDPILDETFLPVIARPLARPRIAAGQTVPGETPWDVWNEGQDAVGIQTVIDTSAAGFTTKPNYFAEVIADNLPDGFVPAWFTSITNAGADNFTVRLFTRRITREPFDIVEPLTQVAATPGVGGSISLRTNAFVQYDLVSRLLPTAENASLVTALTGGTSATLDQALPNFTAARQFAFGNPPRIATVNDVGATPVQASVTVDKPLNFKSGDVVVRISTPFVSSRPTTVSSLDDDNDLILANPITGIAVGDSLAIAGTGSQVVSVTATTVNVQNPENFTQGQFVVCIDAPVENFASTQITAIDPNTHAFTLTPFISGLNGKTIAPVTVEGTVQEIDPGGSEVKIHVDSVASAKLFRQGDLIAKIMPGGVVSEPVRVQSVASSSKSLTLSNTIPGLTTGDQIAAADFRVRSTVLNASGTLLTVANSSLFPVNSTVARLDDNYVPTGHATVTATTSATSLTVSTGIDQPKAGDILALCSFPVSVTVQNVESDGTIIVTPPNTIKTGDVVAAFPEHPSIAIVAGASGNSVQLASAIASLTGGDTLTVVTMSGVVQVTPGASDVKVTLETNNHLRQGDFLADITGWRDAGPIRSTAYVIGISGANVTLNGQIDGLMANDTLGFATLTNGDFYLEIRLQTMPAVNFGDEVLLAGLDRLQGKVKSLDANVAFLYPPSKLILLRVTGSPGTFHIRPADLSASSLLSSPLTLTNQGLYVSWLAVQNPDVMPRPCPPDSAADCPCGKSTQS